MHACCCKVFVKTRVVLQGIERDGNKRFCHCKDLTMSDERIGQDSKKKKENQTYKFHFAIFVKAWVGSRPDLRLVFPKTTLTFRQHGSTKGGVSKCHCKEMQGLTIETVIEMTAKDHFKYTSVRISQFSNLNLVKRSHFCLKRTGEKNQKRTFPLAWG